MLHVLILNEFNLSKSQFSNSDTIKSETLLADSGYGQGQILVNPVHMASIYSSFANDGNMRHAQIHEPQQPLSSHMCIPFLL